MAEDVYYNKLPTKQDRFRFLDAFEKMFGKEYWQKGLTEEQRQRYLADPEYAGKVVGELSKGREQREMAREGAYRKAKYGPESSEYGNFLAMQRATYDPRKGY